MVKLGLVLFLGVIGTLFHTETLARSYRSNQDEDYEATLDEVLALFDELNSTKLGFFGVWDTNMDDKLSREELQSIKNKTSSEEGMTDEEYNKFFDSLDKNGDGFLNPAEFEAGNTKKN